jgi:hypothetical protein
MVRGARVRGVKVRGQVRGRTTGQILLKNPPLLKNHPKTVKCSQVEKPPGSVVGDLFEVAGLFWWCFQLFLFDHLGFFSRISLARLWA